MLWLFNQLWFYSRNSREIARIDQTHSVLAKKFAHDLSCQKMSAFQFHALRYFSDYKSIFRYRGLLLALILPKQFHTYLSSLWKWTWNGSLIVDVFAERGLSPASRCQQSTFPVWKPFSSFKKEVEKQNIFCFTSAQHSSFCWYRKQFIRNTCLHVSIAEEFIFLSFHSLYFRVCSQILLTRESWI